MPQLKVEYAKSGRARCQLKECGDPIESGELRIGTAVLMPGLDTPSFKWRHICCFTKRQLASVKNAEDIENFEDLKPSDQELIKKMVKGELVGDQSVRLKPGTYVPKPKAKPRAKKDKGKVLGRGPGTSDSDSDDSEAAPPPPPATTTKHRWEWQDGGGNWASIDDDVSQEIDGWYKGGADTCRVNIKKWEYKIDFKQMKQINVDTKKSRKLRRVNKDSPSAAAETTTTTTTTSKDEEMKAASDSEEDTEQPHWEWKDDKGKFVKFNSEDSAYFEKQLKKDSMTFNHTVGGNWKYRFNLEKMFQSNETTGTRREIRRMRGDKVIRASQKRKQAEAGDSDSDSPPSKKHKGEKKAPSSPAPKYMDKYSTGGSKKKSHHAKDEDEPFKPKSKGGAGGGAKGGVGAVDKYSGLSDVGKVYSEGKDTFACTLNQTNVLANNNKFYIVQLVESIKGGKWWVWTRWARVGQIGQSKCESFHSVDSAKAAFCKKFQEKTKNSWYERDDFVKYQGKYQLMEIDSQVDPEQAKKALLSVKDKLPDSQLPKRIQDIMEIITDTKMMMSTMKDMDIDTEKMPLGKLSKNQIKQGFHILKKLQTEINGQAKMKVLGDLSSEFYTLIPHDFGWSPPKVIQSTHEVNKKVTLLETLSDIEIASKLLAESHKKQENPFDAAYESLHTVLKPVDRESYAWQTLCDAVKNTHGPTHTAYKLQVLDILEVIRDGEEERFDEYSSLPNHRFLWHGSRAGNLMGILSQGLRIAPPEAPVTGYMFGKGVYFADIVTKSANYCHTNKKSDVGLLLLCQVALGKPYKVNQAEYMEHPPKHYHSTMGVGKLSPDETGDKQLNGVTVATGKPTQQDVSDGSALMYNEFIVYDVAQIQVKYLFKFKFNYL